MPAWEKYGNGVKIILDESYIDLLHEHRIFSHQNINVQRWKSGDPMYFLTNTEMEAYSAIFRGEWMNPLGAYSYMMLPVIGMYQMHFSVGRYCSIGGGLRIVGNAHPVSTLSSSAIFYDTTPSNVEAYRKDNRITDAPFPLRPTGKGVPLVGHDVWLAGDVTLNHGIRIGNGAVVAANAHVTKDVPDYAIVGGNPARIIRYRFPGEVIAELSKIQFWRYSMNDLRHFNVADPARFIMEFQGAEKQLEPWLPKKIHLWNAWKELHNA